MIIGEMFKTGLRFAHFGARIGIEAAQAGLNLAKAAADMLDPDHAEGKGTHDRVSNLLEAMESLVGIVGADRPLGAALRPGGSIDRLFAPGGLIDLLSSENGLNTLIHDAISEELNHLDGTIEELRMVAEHLSAAAAPLGRVAARVPKFLRRPLPYEYPRGRQPLVGQQPAGNPQPSAAPSAPLAQLLDDSSASVSPSSRTNGSRPMNGRTNGAVNGSC